MKIIRVSAAAGLFFYASTALAQVTTSDRQEAVQQLQRQEQKQENLIKYLGKEFERKQRERKTQEISIPTPGQKTIKPGHCFDIKTIELNGAQSLPEKQSKKLTNDYLNTCMDIAAINKLMQEITNFYINKGFVTARVVISQQDLNKGGLELQIVEGKIEAIELNQNSLRDRLQIKMAFPFLLGKALNLRDIEQGLEQINRLASARATMQIVPGSKEGYSKIVIQNNPEGENRATVGFDNSGQKITGKNKGTASLERDNLLGVGDSWSLNFNQDAEDDNGQKNSDILSAMLSVPFGYWTFSANTSHSKYLTTIVGTNQSFQSSGQTDSATVKADRVLYRGQDIKTSANAGLTLKNTTSYIQDVELASGTRQLSILRFGVDQTLRALGGVWYSGVGYERGLDAFGARSDGANLAGTDPRAQFDKFTFDASLYRPFNINQASFAYRTTISGQMSNDTLFASEKINMGDRFTVRGYAESSLAGDSGAYMRNELIWNAPQFTENKYANKVAGNLQPYVALDFGGAKDHSSSGSDYMSGWAVGLRNNSDWISFDVAYSQAIKTLASVTAQDHEKYFGVTAKFSF